MKLLFSFLLVIFVSEPTRAITREQAQLIDKTSYRLRGHGLSFEERVELKTITAADFPEYYDSQTYLYLNSLSFVQVMKNNIDGLLKISHHRRIEGFGDKTTAYDLLVRTILNENRSWDDLLIRQSYEATGYYRKLNNTSFSDFEFLQFVFPDQLKDIIDEWTNNIIAGNVSTSMSTDDVYPTTHLAVKNQDQANLVAGVLTTRRFFSRFATTKLNKNRKRAAEVFRVFLCNPLKPVVLASQSEDQELLEKSLNIKMAHNNSPDNNPMVVDQHAADPQCQSCHSILDPMADVFGGGSLVLSPFASQGALVYKSKNGQDIHRKVHSIGEMAKVITEQPDYLRCQVQHFWDWFIGADVPLDEETRNHLVETFEKLKRKPKDFVKHLIALENFNSSTPLAEEDVVYSHLLPIFQRCDTCHTQDPLAPELSAGYPFKTFLGENDENKEVLAALFQHVDILGNGQQATMPPKDADWTLSPKERDLLRVWVVHGAKDDEGQPHLQSLADIGLPENLPFETEFQSDFEPSFFHTHEKIIAGDSIESTLSILFGDRYNLYCEPNPSLTVNNVLLTAQGYPLARTGWPLFQYANPNYYSMWANCLIENKIPIQNALQNKSASIYGRTVQLYTAWSTLTNPEQFSFLENTLEYVAGKIFLSPHTTDSIMQKVKNKLGSDPKMTLADAAFFIVTATILSEDFLTY